MFDNVKQCQISVASQQFQARNSSDTEYALYCATKPTIEHSHNLRFTCWMGAYPGLTEHFHKANLDPKVNQWDKVRAAAASQPESFACQQPPFSQSQLPSILMLPDGSKSCGF